MADVQHTDIHENKNLPNVRNVKNTVGSDLEITSGGNFLEVDSRVAGTKSMMPKTPYEGNNAGESCVAPYPSARLDQFPVNTDESGTFTGTDKIFYFPPSLGTVLYTYYGKSGSTLASSNVSFKFYRGTSAGDITEENLFFDGIVPPEKWIGDGQEVVFTISEVATGTYQGQESISFAKDVGTIMVTSSNDPFSLKTNSGQDELWYKADLRFIDEETLLTQYRTITPYITLEVDTSGGDVLTPLVSGINYMTNLSEIRSNLFNFVKDPVGGDYYEFLGTKASLYDGITSLGYVSGEQGAEITPGIDIERASGGNDTQLGPRREFDGSNEGNVCFPTDGILEFGDKVRLFLIADQNIENGLITFFRKNVRKVN